MNRLILHRGNFGGVREICFICLLAIHYKALHLFINDKCAGFLWNEFMMTFHLRHFAAELVKTGGVLTFIASRTDRLL